MENQTWVGIQEDTIMGQENPHLFFLRLLLRVPVSTPKVALMFETRILSMEMRIRKRKLLFFHHVRNLKNTDLAKHIWKQQHYQGSPGLAKLKEYAKNLVYKM